MSATLQDVTLISPDISCGHCVATIQSAVGALEGVQHVAANAATKEVSVNFDPARVSLPQIEAALSEAGYPVQQ